MCIRRLVSGCYYSCTYFSDLGISVFRKNNDVSRSLSYLPIRSEFALIEIASLFVVCEANGVIINGSNAFGDDEETQKLIVSKALGCLLLSHHHPIDQEIQLITSIADNVHTLGLQYVHANIKIFTSNPEEAIKLLWYYTEASKCLIVLEINSKS
jgi:hypothetical protein